MDINRPWDEQQRRNGALRPKIKFKRTKSLMEGDEECDPKWGRRVVVAGDGGC